MAEKLGRHAINFEPLRIDEQHLLPFLIEYLQGRKRKSFTDEEYQSIRHQIQTVVGSRKVTALFVTMYADVLLYQLARDPQRPETPKDLPELILAYIHRINSTIDDGRSTSDIVNAGKILAWACLKRRLQPGEINRQEALGLLQALNAAEILPS